MASCPRTLDTDYITQRNNSDVTLKEPHDSHWTFIRNLINCLHVQLKSLYLILAWREPVQFTLDFTRESLSLDQVKLRYFGKADLNCRQLLNNSVLPLQQWQAGTALLTA